MSIVTTTANSVLNYLFGNTAYTSPTPLYVGLSTSTISDTGANITEPTGGAYARVSIANNKTTFSVASGGSLSNAITITFVESSASWGIITDVFFGLGATVGVADALYFQALPTPKTVQTATTISFATNAIVISMTN